MPRPILHARTGVFHLNVRVPADLAARMRASRVTLPLDDGQVTVVVTDKVAFSLRTKDAATAKARFVPAHAALARHFAAVRAGPRPLTHRQVVALAGVVFRGRVARDEADPDLGPEHVAREVAAWEGILAETAERDGTDGDGEIDPRRAAVLAHAVGDRLPALQFRDPDEPEVERLRALYGEDLASVLAGHGLVVDAGTERRLLGEIDRAAVEAAEVSVRQMEGDFSPTSVAARFPEFVPDPAPAPLPAEPAASLTFARLAERWSDRHRELKAESTVRRYGPSLRSLAAFLGTKDVRAVTDEDVWRWAEHRRDVERVAPKTVNRNDVVAVSSVLSWATKRDGGRLLSGNPASGVRLEVPKLRTIRPPTFYDHEIEAVLRAARAAKPDPRFPRASASRRWTPWVCAHSGARIQEVCWLRKEDVWCEAGVWVMRFLRTKDGFMRVVPLHDGLVAEGFVDFVRAAPDGYLFVGDRPQKAGATRSAPEQRASELAEWIRAQAGLPVGVSPNHAWRHTFLTRAEAAGVPKRMANALAGHNRKRDASDGYVTPDVRQLKAEIDKVPAYEFRVG